MPPAEPRRRSLPSFFEIFGKILYISSPLDYSIPDFDGTQNDGTNETTNKRKGTNMRALIETAQGQIQVNGNCMLLNSTPNSSDPWDDLILFCSDHAERLIIDDDGQVRCPECGKPFMFYDDGEAIN